MIAIFFDKPHKVGEDETGLPYYENRTFIRVHRNATHVVERLSKEEDHRRFPGEYEGYLNTKKEPEENAGFPIDMWPRLTPADVSNLKARGVYTVQQLATADSKDWPPAAANWQPIAREFVKLAGQSNRDTNLIEDLKAQNEILKEDKDALSAQVTRLKAELSKANEATV